MGILNNALYWSHEYVHRAAGPGDVVVDGTMGNGGDTLFLSNLVGEAGRVYAFDIQEQALYKTRQRLAAEARYDNTELILSGHETMQRYVNTDVSAVMFNFGYLPGGDHKIGTRPDTDLIAIQAALSLLKPAGVLTACIYSGGDTGFAEKEAILAFVETLDPKQYFVLRHEYVNQPNCPPILVCIEKSN